MIKLGDRVKLKDDFLGLKIGHQGLVVGKMGNLLLILFDNYHKGHDSRLSKVHTTYLKGYSYRRLFKIDGGCLWLRERDLQPICLLKSWKGNKR